MPDIAAEFLSGVQAGSQIRQRQAQLQQERVQAQLEAQARQQQQDNENMREEQRLRVQEAMRQSEIGLQQQRLQEVQQQNAAKTRDAALKLSDQQGFASDLAGGMPIEQALYRHPRLATPQAAINAHKDTLDLSSQRLDLAKKRLDMEGDARARTAKDREDAAAAKNNGVPMIKGLQLGGPDAFGGPHVDLRADDPRINSLMGTNAPAGTGTNYDASVGQTAAPAGPKSPYAEGTVLTSKKNPGQKFIVKNGVPVAMDSEADSSTDQ